MRCKGMFFNQNKQILSPIFDVMYLDFKQTTISFNFLFYTY